MTFMAKMAMPDLQLDPYISIFVILKTNYFELWILYKSDLQRNWVFATNRFSNPTTQCRRPKIWQTLNSVRSKNLSLNYGKFTPSGAKI